MKKSANPSFWFKRLLASSIFGYLIGNMMVYLYTHQSPIFLQLYYALKYRGIDVPIYILVAYGIAFICAISPLLMIRKAKNKYGYARKATRADIQEMGLFADKGIFLGTAFGLAVRYAEALSTLILAPPGTGKTSGIVMPILLTNKDNTFIIHDPKGELLKATSVYRSQFSKVSVFDPVNAASSPFNALDNTLLVFDDHKPNLGASRKHIENVATILMPIPDGTADSYWLKAGRSLFIFLALWLLWHDEKVSIPAILELLYSQPDANKLFEALQRGDDPRGNSDICNSQAMADAKAQYNLLQSELEKGGELTKSELDDLAKYTAIIQGGNGVKGVPPALIIQEGNSILATSKSENQLAGILGTFKEQLAVFMDETVANNTREGCAFTSDLLRKERTTLYVVVRDADKERLKTLTALLFEILANQLSSKMPSKNDITVTFMLDEFVRLGKLTAVKELPAISRGYRANVLFIAQEFAQIQTTYGQEAADVFESTCGYKVVLCQTNIKAAKKISETIGNKTVKRVSESADKTKLSANKKSESTSEEGIPLYSAQDILNLPKDKCLILAQGHIAKPIEANIAYWFKDKELTKVVNKYGYDNDAEFEDVYKKLNLKG